MNAINNHAILTFRDHFDMASHPILVKVKLEKYIFLYILYITTHKMGKRKASVDHSSSSRHVKVEIVEKQLDVETPYLGNLFFQIKPVSKQC